MDPNDPQVAVRWKQDEIRVEAGISERCSEGCLGTFCRFNLVREERNLHRLVLSTLASKWQEFACTSTLRDSEAQTLKGWSSDKQTE